MTRHDDILLSALAALPSVAPDPARAERLRQRCHATVARRARPKPQRTRRLWQRLVRWSVTLSHPVAQE